MTKRKRSRARWHQKFYKDWRTNGLGTALGRREETNPRGKNVRNVVKTRFGILTLMHFLKVRFDSMMIHCSISLCLLRHSALHPQCASLNQKLILQWKYFVLP